MIDQFASEFDHSRILWNIFEDSQHPEILPDDENDIQIYPIMSNTQLSEKLNHLNLKDKWKVGTKMKIDHQK